jgi:hypothetical protein
MRKQQDVMMKETFLRNENFADQQQSHIKRLEEMIMKLREEMITEKLINQKQQK